MCKLKLTFLVICCLLMLCTALVAVLISTMDEDDHRALLTWILKRATDQNKWGSGQNKWGSNLD